MRSKSQTDHGSTGEQAVVIGGGMAGLLTARVLSDHFESVIVLERDQISDVPQPRKGIPQGKHVHSLLNGGLNIIAALLPDITDDLDAAGAVKIRSTVDLIATDGVTTYPRRDLGISYYGQSRSVLDHCIRSRVELIPNVTLLDGCRVTSLTSPPDRTRITGLNYLDRSTQHSIDSTLVVDCSGRHARTPEWLEQLGYQPPSSVEIGIDLTYATAVFDIPENTDVDALAIAIGSCPPTGKRSGYLQTIEGKQWIVSLAGRWGEYPQVDLESFQNFALHLNTHDIFRAIRGLTPVGPIQRHHTPSSIWRRYSQLEHFPKGLLPLGDAIASINPTYGQGMSSAASQVWAIHELLAESGADHRSLDSLAQRFFARADQSILTPWSQAAETDLAFNEATGERPRRFERSQQYARALKQLAHRDPACHAVLFQVMHMMLPFSALTSSEIFEQAMEQMRCDNAIELPPSHIKRESTKRAA